MYHAVSAPPFPCDPEEEDTFVPPDGFAWQMADLARRGFRTLRLEEYRAALGSGRRRARSFLLTFDDAYTHVDEVVTPILQRHGFTAVMFAAWQHLGQRNNWDGEHPNLSRLDIATRDRLASMDAGCWEIASHALQHVDLRQLSPARRQADLREAREGLSELLHRPVLELAYPYGLSDPAVREDARVAGYQMAFTASGGNVGDWFQLPRRPIRGKDGAIIFRLKTSPRSEGFYRAGDFAPGWARTAARAVLKRAAMPADGR